MPIMSFDVKYFRINRPEKPEYKAHVLKSENQLGRAGPYATSLCGPLHTTGIGRGRTLQVEDRLQADWEFCGRCSRIVTARADTT